MTLSRTYPQPPPPCRRHPSPKRPMRPSHRRYLSCSGRFGCCDCVTTLLLLLLMMFGARMRSSGHHSLSRMRVFFYMGLAGEGAMYLTVSESHTLPQSSLECAAMRQSNTHSSKHLCYLQTAVFWNSWFGFLMILFLFVCSQLIKYHTCADTHVAIKHAHRIHTQIRHNRV